MNTRVKVCVWTCAWVCLAVGTGYAQQATASKDTSLGDIARQIKAEKAKESKTKPTLVLTNDTIARSDTTPGFNASSAKKNSSEAAPDDSSSAEKHDAEYFRSHQKRLEDQLQTHQRELSVLQQKLGQNQMQYYPNPQDSLMQQYTRGDIDKLTAQIDAKKQQIDDDEKAIDDLREQLRREGGDPGWLRQ